jgi:hypothetical protein
MECRRFSADRPSSSERTRPHGHRVTPVSPSRARHDVPAAPDARPAPAIPSALDLPLASDLAADLVIRMATVIPLPDPSLGTDIDAWAAFDAVIDEAAALLTTSLGADAALVLGPIAATAIATDPVCHALLERALNQSPERRAG